MVSIATPYPTWAIKLLRLPESLSGIIGISKYNATVYWYKYKPKNSIPFH